EIPDQTLGHRRVLHAVFLLAALTERSAVEADDGRVTEVGIDAIEAGSVGHGDVNVVHPGHALGDHDLLFLGGVHVALATDDELGPAHGAVAPDFRIIAVVADDQADLEPLGPVGNVRAVAGIPALDGAPGHDLAVLLHDLALIVHQDQGVVR